MDVVINSQIQSPLVRTLARTKGKSQSFTHNIADNVAPCSFTKIQLSSQNQGETQFGRNYKLKIPQYGYLRDIVLKYTTEERPIDAKVVEVVKPLYTHYYTALEDVRAAGSHLAVSNPATTGTSTLGGISQTWTRATDITWYNAQNLVRATANNGYASTNIDTTTMAEIASVLVPQFSSLLTTGSSVATITPNNGSTTATSVGATGTVTTVSSGTAIGSTSVAGPYTQLLKLNGTPRMWSAHFRLYYSIYQLAIQGGGATYPLAKAVWNALLNEPVQTINMDLYSSVGVAGPADISSDFIISDSDGTLAAIGANTSKSVTCTLPRNVVAISRGGQTFWVPKIPQLRFDANGSIIGVDFVPLHLLHPNDNGDSTSDIALISKLSLSADNAKYNYRQFPFGAARSSVDDWYVYMYLFLNITNIANEIGLHGTGSLSLTTTRVLQLMWLREYSCLLTTDLFRPSSHRKPMLASSSLLLLREHDTLR